MAKWLNLNVATTFINDRFTDHEAQADTFVIDTCSPLQFSKLSEELAEVFSENTDPSVFYLHNYAAILETVRCPDIDLTAERELNGVLN